MNEAQIELKFKSSRFRDLWLEFCQKHRDLYEVTCDEYTHLLASDIDELETTIDEKQNIINYINKLELSRNQVAAEIATLMGLEKPEKLTTMLKYFHQHGLKNEADEVEKLNLVLLEIIENIQAQNKKNQVFLNKAIISLNELRHSFSGKENFKTYSSSGMARRG